MNIAPPVAPNIEVIPKWCKSPPGDQEFKHSFKFQGKVYGLFKRDGSPGAPWYFRVMVGGRSIKTSLKTPIRADAEKRAKIHLGRVLDKEWRQPEVPAVRGVSTLGEVMRAYEDIALISPAIIRNNQTMMMRILTVALGLTDPDKIRIDVLTEALAEDYERMMVRNYEGQVTGAADKREARLRALRTAKSTHNQAKSIFNSKRNFLRKYNERGLVVPESVAGFCRASLSGRIAKASFSPPSQSVIDATFARIGELAAGDAPAHLLFWIMVGTGLRRSECAEFKGADLRAGDGALWVSGGIGKDGKVIQVPVQSKAVPYLRDYADQLGYVLPGDHRMRHDTIPARLNGWLNTLGWHDQKKGHALRAYIGGRIFEKNPRAAQAYLRHKSITTTEAFYSHFARLDKAAMDVL